VNDPRGYDAFAAVYNRHWWQFSVDALPVLERLLFARLAPAATILDVGCGAGQYAAMLIQRGYHVVGMDGSAEMLRFAQANAPSVSLFQADVRCFAIARPLDAAISLSDVLNHLLTPEDLGAALGCIADALTPDGWLLFDINTEAKYTRHWTGSFGLVEDDQVCVVRASYEPDSRMARFDATVFLELGGWQRSDLTIFERCHKDEEVRLALDRAGFDEVQVFDWQRDLDADGEPAKTFWLCRKSRS
jgi:SAM-dependent methyltransferase